MLLTSTITNHRGEPQTMPKGASLYVLLLQTRKETRIKPVFRREIKVDRPNLPPHWIEVDAFGLPSALPEREWKTPSLPIQRNVTVPGLTLRAHPVS